MKNFFKYFKRVILSLSKGEGACLPVGKVGVRPLLLLSILLFTCTAITDAQHAKPKTAKEKLEEAWQELKRSKDSTMMLVTQIKQLANQKVIYRTKLVERTDTVWRIDTCITVLRPIDSATIALYFRPRDTPRVTRVGKIIRYIFHGKNKKK